MGRTLLEIFAEGRPEPPLIPNPRCLTLTPIGTACARRALELTLARLVPGSPEPGQHLGALWREAWAEAEHETDLARREPVIPVF
jgi:hypothetical protein